MRRLIAVFAAATLSACADAPMEPAGSPLDDPAMGLTTLEPPCVYFTKDRTQINGSLDCEENAFGLDVSFAGGPATIRVAGMDIQTPRGITGFRMSFQPATGSAPGELTGLQWKQGTRTINQDVLPSGAVGQEFFDVFAMRFTDVRWMGGSKIDIPKDANDLHYFILRSNT